MIGERFGVQKVVDSQNLSFDCHTEVLIHTLAGLVYS